MEFQQTFVKCAWENRVVIGDDASKLRLEHGRNAALVKPVEEETFIMVTDAIL